MKIKIDDTNRRILNILQERGSITNADLAGLIGLSPATVFERVKKLEKHGVIKRYVALIDSAKVGKSITAFISLTLSDYSAETIAEMSKAIRKMPEVLECYSIAGEKDFLLKVVARDIPDYESFLFGRLAKIAAVGKFSSMFVLSTVKNHTKISLDEAPGSEPASG